MTGKLRRWILPLLMVLLLGGLYLATRLTNLTIHPIFTDEAIYIRWSQIGSRDAAWRFISLTDGKQPMFTWIMMVVLKFIHDPLFAGRFVSVIAGMGTLTGLSLLSHELFKKWRVSLIVAMLYIISPYSLLYDRMALYDSLVAAFSIWNLYLGILLVRHVRLDIALILGLTLGAGMLNKTSGFLSLYLLPMTLVLFDWRQKERLARLVRWVGYALVAALLSQALYSVLRLSPFFHIIEEKNAVFVYPLPEWLEHTFRFVQGNLRGMFDWIVSYLTIPIFLCAMGALLYPRKYLREKLLLYAWWFVPLMGLAIFARILYPRFILFMTMPLLLLAAVVIDTLYERLKSRVGVVALGAIVLFLPSVITDVLLLTNPVRAPITKSDKTQYLQDWPSGWGVAEVVAYLQTEAEKGPISVYTEGTFGLFPYAIEIYLVDHPNVKIAGLWPVPQAMPQDIAQDAMDHPTYFITNQLQTPPSWPLRLIAEYSKRNPTDLKLRLFQVVSPLVTRL